MRSDNPRHRPWTETQQSTTPPDRARPAVTSNRQAMWPGRPCRPARDLANLVPLESIGAETDIRAFLAAGVPPELTRAALRRAWLSDPKIRNFVGLADYDWDFNTPGSMAGFGIL